jgi:hypothetical protein
VLQYKPSQLSPTPDCFLVYGSQDFPVALGTDNRSVTIPSDIKSNENQYRFLVTKSHVIQNFSDRKTFLYGSIWL